MPLTPFPHPDATTAAASGPGAWAVAGADVLAVADVPRRTDKGRPFGPSPSSAAAIGALVAALGMPLVLTYTAVVSWASRGEVRLGASSYR